MIEVCVAHEQFALDPALPRLLCGPHAADARRVFAEVQAAFRRLVGRLGAVPYNALDTTVRAGRGPGARPHPTLAALPAMRALKFTLVSANARS